jgi:hypothetical protein
MANVLIPKKSTVAAKVPTTSDLAHGEIAVNYADQIIYGRDPSSGAIKVLSGDVTVNNTTTTTVASSTLARFTPRENQPPATAFATLDTRNSIAVLDFDATTVESAIFSSVIPEAADLTSGLKVRLLWMATTATSGNCRWGVQVERANTDLDSDSYDTAAEAHTAAPATSGIPTLTEITLTTIDGLTAGDTYRLKVYRKADDATNDTMTGDAELIAVEVRSAA